MKDLYWLDVSAKHIATPVMLRNNRSSMQVQQMANLAGATALFDHYLQESIKDLVEGSEYSKIFNTVSDPYKQNANTIGYLTVQYDGEILKEYWKKRIAIKKQDYSIAFQNPTIDLELDEWLRGFGKENPLGKISTKDDGFATGFCLVEGINKVQDLPFNTTNHRQWVQKILPLAEKQEIKDLYVFTPMGMRSDSYSEQGIVIHFIPISDTNLDDLNRRIVDNKNLIKTELHNTDDPTVGPIEIQSMVTGDIADIENQTMMGSDNISGSAAINIGSKAQEKVNMTLERVKLALDLINNDQVIRSSDYKFSVPHPSIEI